MQIIENLKQLKTAFKKIKKNLLAFPSDIWCLIPYLILITKSKIPAKYDSPP